MSSVDSNKHHKRLIRMLSKYGDVKKDVLSRNDNKQSDELCSDSSSTSSSKYRLKREISQHSRAPSVDQVDCNTSAIPDSTYTDGIVISEPLAVSQKLNVNLFNSPTAIQQRNLSRAISEQTSNETSDNDIGATYFDMKPFDFFSNDTENEKLSNKPFIFINSFRQNEVPLIPTNFYHRKNDGFLWRWTGFKCLKNLLDNKSNRHRPLFTYWLMLLEFVILILIMSTYGTGYFGFSKKNVSDIVWHESNSYQPATYSEPCNMWFGPSPSILIREGAIFTPCMKDEKLISDSIQRQNDQDNQSGCCIRLDNSGCVQTIQSKCSKRTSVWVKWKGGNPGPVCGQDPRYCLDRNKPWPSKLSDWPVCHHNNRSLIIAGQDSHMKCKVQARPCCHGIYGKCILTSKEYCEFIKGKYHPKATLCSQVRCLNDVCGLIPFEKKPNQMYRLLLSLFLHAGLIQIAITFFIQWRFMAVFEETYGTRKIILLYLISGIGGNLASALFLPMTPEIGPMGAFFGILSLLLYEIISNRHVLDNPCWTFFKVSNLLPIFFFLGVFFPWINNFSNIFGFIFGFLTVFLILPDNYKKKSFYICLSLIILLATILTFFFYNPHHVEPYIPYFQYLNCIPITDTWCSSMDIAVKEIKALN